VLGVGFGTQGYAPALGPELLRDRNSYKNNTARAPAFQTWAVQWKKFAKLQRIVLDSGGQAELRVPSAAAQTRNGLCEFGSFQESQRPFKGIICDDISESL
jgi:hypothetical protein